MRLVVISKRPYAVGLKWTTQKQKSDMKRSRSEFRAEAHGLDPAFDMMTRRQSQYAFGDSEGHPQDFLKACSLAASLRDLLHLSSSFLGMFCLQAADGETVWWVVAVKDSLITAYSDKVYADREQAESQLRELTDLLRSVDRTVVLETPEESRTWLAPLLSTPFFNPPRMEPLVELSVQRNKKRLLLGGAFLLAALWIGTNMWFEHQSNLRAMEAAKAALRSKEERQKELLAYSERQFPTPWLSAPTAHDVWSRCAPALLSLPLSASGWEFESATCDGKTVSVVWGHRPGADYLLLPPKANLGKTAQQAVSRFELPGKPESGHGVSHRNLPDKDEVSRYLYQVTQDTATRLKLSYAPRQRKTVDKIEIVAPWLAGTWELTDVPETLVLDSSLADALHLPGLTLNSVECGKTSWTLRGQTYVVEEK